MKKLNINKEFVRCICYYVQCETISTFIQLKLALQKYSDNNVNKIFVFIYLYIYESTKKLPDATLFDSLERKPSDFVMNEENGCLT